MKDARIYLSMILGLVFFISSCDKVEEDEIDTSFAEVESQADDAFSEVDGIAQSSLTFYSVGGRTTEEGDSLIRCATKSINFETKTITIDFGDGCEGLHGRIRKGKIIITYTTFFFLPGAEITITFDNFYINDIKVEGTRTFTNISESLEANPTFQVELMGGKLTWPDATFATRESDFIETWLRAANPLNDQITIEGSASGTNRQGTQYTMTITSPLILKRSCWSSRAFIPVQGIKEIEANEKLITVDYGDGTCDRLVTITVDGVSRTIEVARGE